VQVNDLVRDKVAEANHGKLPLYGEILAGGMVSKANKPCVVF